MNKLIGAVIELFKVKTILSLLIVGTTCYLAVIEKLDLTAFMTIAGSIVTYYFTKEKEVKNEEEKKDE